jgi:hypothetical protein
MDGPVSTPPLPKEALMLAALDTIWRKAEEALAKIQDDSRMSGPHDKTVILQHLYVIDVKVKEIRELLASSGTYSSERPDE